MKYVLITGGTSGIGYELAKRFALNGYGILIAASNQSRLEQVQKNLKKEFKVPVSIYQQDLSHLGAAAELYQKIKRDKIKIAALVNNAGFGQVGATEQIDFQKDEELMVLNMITPVELCKLFLPDMYQQGKGKILNVSSTGSFQPGPYSSTYFASKSFLLSYSRAISYEARKKGVSVCTLCPGTTDTDFFRREGRKTPKGAMSAKVVAKYAYERLMKEKELAVPGMLNKLLRMIPVKIKIPFVAQLKK